MIRKLPQKTVPIIPASFQWDDLKLTKSSAVSPTQPCSRYILYIYTHPISPQDSA